MPKYNIYRRIRSHLWHNGFDHVFSIPLKSPLSSLKLSCQQGWTFCCSSHAVIQTTMKTDNRLAEPQRSPLTLEYIILPLATNMEKPCKHQWMNNNLKSSACIWYLFPAFLLYSHSPNYADYPTLKLNFPNCYIKIRI